MSRRNNPSDKTDPKMKNFVKHFIFYCLAFVLMLAVIFTVLALCQPHSRTREITVERRGVDVIIALDVSNSMLAKDIAPNRLEKAKLELASLIDALKQDRIGIVAFAGEAFIQCPLTTDKSAAKLFLQAAHPNLIPTPGTMIGAAIRVATQAFTEKEKEYKALVLLTDGEDQGSDPMGAAAKAKAQGVRIFAIGVGTSEGGTVPGETAEGGFKRDRRGNVVLTKLDEGLLKRITVMTGGDYFRASKGEVEIDRVAAEIRRMAQKGLKTEKRFEYEEGFQQLLWLALLMLFVEMALSERRKSARHAALLALILLLVPFVSGWKFYSAARNEEGNRHYLKGRIGEAQKAYETALNASPEAPEVAYNLGNAYYKEDSFDKSLQAYSKAAKNAGPALQSGAYYNLGNALVRKEDKKKAIEAYKQALRLNPADQDAKFNLELLLKEEGEEKKKDQQQKQDQQEQQKQQQKDQEKKEQQQQEQKQDQQQKEQEQKQQEQGEEEKEQEQAQEKEQEEQKPKTPEQRRAEQILDALQNQERQVLKAQTGKRAGNVRRYVEKDW